MRRWIGTLMVLAVAVGATVGAEDRSATQNREGRAVLWTLVGAGAGFGIGLWAGLTAFDDAINSDRKVWTTAILSAAGGGTAGYLIGRRRDASSSRVADAALAPANLRSLPPLADAPRLGSGEFRGWLSNARMALEPNVHPKPEPDPPSMARSTGTEPRADDKP